MKTLILIPAYGRKYRNNVDVKADWYKGRDFQISDVGCRFNNMYANLSDLLTNVEGYTHVKISYAIQHRGYMTPRTCVIEIVEADTVRPDPERGSETSPRKSQRRASKEKVDGSDLFS